MKLKNEKRMKILIDWRRLVKKFQTSTMLFTKLKKMYLNSVEKKNSTQEKELRLLMYSDIDSFPLLKFMDCLCDDNMSSLYKDSSIIPIAGIRNEDIELKVFHELYLQFLDRFFENDNTIFDNKRKLMLTYSKISILEIIEQSYYSLKSKQIVVKILRKYGVRLTDNDETNLIIISGAKETLIRKYKEIIQKIGDNIDEESDENEKGWKRRTFVDIISSLSNFFDRQIPITLICVGEFCSLYQIMKKQPKPTQKQNFYGKRSY